MSFAFTFNFTDAQLAEMTLIEQQWRAVALSTEPANRADAKRGIHELYRAAKQQPPERILWCQSPFEAMMTVAYLKGRFWRRLWKSERARYSEPFWQTFKHNFLSNFQTSLSDVFWDDIGERMHIGIVGPRRQNTELERSVWQALFSY